VEHVALVGLKGTKRQKLHILGSSLAGALATSRDLSPKLEALRYRAKQAHVCGDLTEALRLLDAIDQDHIEAERRLFEYRDELEEEILLRKRPRKSGMLVNRPIEFHMCRHEKHWRDLEGSVTHNLIRVDLITKIAHFFVAAAALTFVSMLLLTTLHP
jgi:hypothetical protein